MTGALAIALPLTLAGVLIFSAIAKFRSPDDLAGWAEIGVPARLRTDGLRRLHPWGELALGIAIAVLGGMLGLLAALVAVGLMSAYTWLLFRVERRQDDASCACFGVRRRVTKVTVIRNAWLTALAVATAATSWMTPLIGGPLLYGLKEGAWVIGLVVAAGTTALILWPEEGPAVTPAESGGAGVVRDDERDYIRTRTPAVPVTLADGRVENLRTLSGRKPILLLSVSATCSPCGPVIEKIDEWRDLLPEVDVRFLLATAPAESPLIETSEPQSLHDPDGYLRQSLDMPSTPTAVLLGVDGMLAGGPVVGTDDVKAFVEEIHESLREVRPAHVSTVADEHG